VLGIVFVALGVIIPIALYFYREMQQNTPSLRWPKVATMVHLTYEADPPRMSGQWHGKEVTVVLRDGQAFIAAILPKPSRLRVEVADKEIVAKRAGMLVHDAVATGDSAFDERLTARCSDKNAGLGLFDPALRQRLLAQPHVDIVGDGNAVRWTVPDANDPDLLEQMLDIVSVIATEMERYS
jgi:hypothetical protein